MKVVPFSEATRDDFFALHHEAGWCYCVAWWVETWDGWSDRTAADNLQLRQALCDRGEYDGYLLYVDNEVVGWCQVGQRDRLQKLTTQFNLPLHPTTWAITCFYITKAYRERGFASHLLRAVLKHLKARGVSRVEAFPKRGVNLEAGELWNGPESMFRAAGFVVVQDDPVRPVLRLEF